MPQKFSVIKKFRYIECCTSEHSLGGLIILHNIPALNHAILKFVQPSKVMKHDLSTFSAISMTINDIKGDKFLYRKKCSRYSKRIGESEHLFPNLTTKPDRIVPISVIWDAYFASVQPYRFRYIKSPLYEIPLYAMCNV